MAAAPRKKALCIGISYAGTEAEIPGPVNDALHWVEVLTQHCNFHRSNVLAMIDEYPSGEAVLDDDDEYMQPTKENIMEALDWLVEDAAQGDILFFIFSGHGVSLPDSVPVNGEAHLEEAICPVDWEEFEWGLVPYRLISMSLLHRYFAKLPGGVLFTAVFDTCLVGDPLRVPFRTDYRHPERELQCEAVTQAEYEDCNPSSDAWLQNEHVNALPRRPPVELRRPLWSHVARHFLKDTSPPLHEGLALFCFAACRGAQSAIDASLEGLAQGCLSYCLLRALELLNYTCTYAQLAETTNKVARRLRSEVMPELDQFFQLSYGKNARPSECVAFDPTSAFVAKDRARRRRGQWHRPA